MVYQIRSTSAGNWGEPDGHVALPEPGSRRIWPSPIPAHAIFTPPAPTEEGRWQNDLHISQPQRTP
jgi:hypothetical protein